MASFSVVSNIASANAQTNLQATNLGLNRALSRLSSGFRINRIEGSVLLTCFVGYTAYLVSTAF